MMIAGLRDRRRAATSHRRKSRSSSAGPIAGNHSQVFQNNYRSVSYLTDEGNIGFSCEAARLPSARPEREKLVREELALMQLPAPW